MTETSSRASGLYITAELDRFSLDSESVLARVSRDGSISTLSALHAHLLTLCRTPRSLSDQAEAAIPFMPDHLHAEDIRALLEDLVESGLLVPLEIEPVPHTLPADRAVTQLIIPTRDRPELVARLTDSVAVANPAITVPVTIVDDSDTPTQPRESSVYVHLPDRLGRDGPFEALYASGVPEQTIRFALVGDRRCPPSLGAMRNTNYLLGAGRRVVTMDDDTVAVGFRTSAAGAPICFTGSRDEPVFEFAPDRISLLESDEISPLDPVAASEEWLGRQVPGTDSDLSSVTPELFRLLSAHHPTIDVVCHGTIGDGGLGVRHFVLQATGSQRERFVRDAETYHISTTSRELLRSVTAPIVLSYPYLMSTVMGLDCTVLLPPSFPYGRGDEGLFAKMIYHLFDDSLILQAPTVFLHSPPDDATHRAAPWFTELPVRVCSLLQMILDTYPKPPGGTRADRLVTFGEWLRAHTARLSDREFTDWLTGVHMRYLAAYHRNLDELLDRYNESPSYWSEDVLALQANVRTQLEAGHIAAVEEFKPLSLSREDEHRLLRTHFAAYAEVLIAWPQMFMSLYVDSADGRQ